MNERRQQVLNLLKDGYTGADIANKLTISSSTVYSHKKKLIELGEITEEEIKLAQKEKKKKKKKLTYKQRNVLNLLKKGYRNYEIASKLKIKTQDVYYYKKILIKIGKITEEEIISAQGKKNSIKLSNTQKKVLRGLEKGKNTKQIAKSVKCTVNTVNYNRRKFISDGLYSIDELKKIPKKLTKKQRKVLNLYKRGYRSSEIARELNLSLSSVSHFRKRLIDINKIIEEEIISAQEYRKKYGEIKKSKKDEIIGCLEEGLDIDEIMELVNCSENYIYYVKKRLYKIDGDNELTKDDMINTLKAFNNEEFLNKILITKTPVEKMIISMRLGLNDGNNYSVDDISNMLDISYEEVNDVLNIFFNELSSYIKDKSNTNNGTLKLLNKEEN